MKTTLTTPLRTLALCGLFGTIGAGCLSATVTLPYSNDFSSDADDFSAATGFTYDVGTYGEVYHYERGSSATGLSLVDVTDLASPVDFTVSTSFTPLLVGAGRSFGFAVMSDAGSSEYLLVDWSTVNSLRLHEIGGAGLLNSNTGSITMTQDAEYTLTFSGIYTDTVNKIMDLSFSVSDGTNTDTVTYSGFDATDLSGNTLVGYRAYGLYANTVEFDNFSVSAIPEPSTLALLLGAGMGALVFVRRKPRL
ncbi:MAG TPA: hypothetical protein DEA90_14880 [Opitutae bacterium]|nr:hypothetical protein [Puniceicoccaceae bacterium]HBR95443.1 hypothetical protein [Opitutae bacterium]|tara:strand:- start:477 stop:1226 length:750 start_codon:yes stop_codon:yes gene_type:complete